MIGILHCGGLFETPLDTWVANLVQALTREGHRVHVVCAETRPARFAPAGEAYRYLENGAVETRLFRETAFPGSVWIHQIRGLGAWGTADADTQGALTARVAEVLAGRELANCLATDPSHAAALAHRITTLQPLTYGVLAPPAALRRLIEREGATEDAGVTGASRVFCVDSDAARVARDRVSSMPDALRRLVLLPPGIDTSLYSPIGSRQRVERVAALATGLDPAGAGRRAGARAAMETVRTSETQAPDETGLRACFDAVGDYDASRPDHDAAASLLTATWASDVVLGVEAPREDTSCGWALLAALPALFEQVPGARVVVWGGGAHRDRFELALLALAAGDEAWLRRILQGVGGGGMPPAPLAPVSGERALADWARAGASLVDPRRVVMTGTLSEDERRALLPCLDFVLREADAGVSGVDGLLAAMAAGAIPIAAGSARIGETGDTLASYLAVEVVRHTSLPDAFGAWSEAILRAVATLQAERDALRASFRQITVERHDWRNVAARLAIDLPRPRQALTLLARDTSA